MRAAPAFAALLLLFGAAPAEAEHCTTGIAIHGRPAFSPAILPPALPRACVTLETSGSTGHVLAPATTEVFVRVDADLGGTYPQLILRLDGLGFRDQTFQLTRTTTSPIAGWTYDVADWLSLPDPEPGGTLRAMVRFPGNHEASAQYVLLGVPPR